MSTIDASGTYLLLFDGGSRGHATGKLRCLVWKFLDPMSNNIAEYYLLLLGLLCARSLGSPSFERTATVHGGKVNSLIEVIEGAVSKCGRRVRHSCMGPEIDVRPGWTIMLWIVRRRTASMKRNFKGVFGIVLLFFRLC